MHKYSVRATSPAVVLVNSPEWALSALAMPLLFAPALNLQSGSWMEWAGGQKAKGRQGMHWKWVEGFWRTLGRISHPES